MSEKYFLDELEGYRGEIGGHYSNLSLAAKYAPLFHLEKRIPIEEYFPWDLYGTEDGNVGVTRHIFDNIGLEFDFVLDIGAYSTMASNVVPIVGSRADSLLQQGQSNIKIKALLIDGENKHNDAHVVKEWITRENVCDCLSTLGCPKRMDFISLDIDNMDYWVLKEMLEADYLSNLLIAEFNPAFSFDESYTKCYTADDSKDGIFTAGSSNYGVSLKALTDLTGRFGYRLVHVMQENITVGRSNNAIFLQSRFDTENKFADQTATIQSLHPEPFIETHKFSANRQKFGTDSLEEIRVILKDQFDQI
jgi:hypothetical protein